MKSLQYIFTFVSIAVWLFVVFAFVEQKKSMPENHIEIVMRDIGHKILLYAHDSTSRVLPIERINDHTYQISFENAFTFVPDSLIQVVHRTMNISHMPPNYTVKVKDCYKLQTIFAFEINEQDGGIAPCSGRNQQSSCYLIEVSFVRQSDLLLFMMILATLALLIGGGLWWMQSRKFTTSSASITSTPSNASNEAIIEHPQSEEYLTNKATAFSYTYIGQLKFYSQKNMLECGSESISLSDRESKLLSIFADNINQVVTREHLLKEVWEDDGVLVMSRNLDVFVSKLRKKLTSDPAVKIVNVHSKGYRLIVE